MYERSNNANFGIDCQNNINNCTFEPIYDEIGEICYIKKFGSIFNNEKYSHFLDTNLSKEEVEEKYSKLCLVLDQKAQHRRLKNTPYKIEKKKI